MNPDKVIKEIEACIENALINFNLASEGVGKELHDKYVQPFCKKWGLYFYSGMGMYVFTHIKSGENVYSSDAEVVIEETKSGKFSYDEIYDKGVSIYRIRAFYEELKAIEQVLDFNISVSNFEAYADIPDINK